MKMTLNTTTNLFLNQLLSPCDSDSETIDVRPQTEKRKRSWLRREKDHREAEKMDGGAANIPNSPNFLSKIGLDFYVRKVFCLKSDLLAEQVLWQARVQCLNCS